MKKIILILTIIMSACMQKTIPPVANKIPYEMTEHGDTRIDNYYWMRLTDEQKSANKYDKQTQEVVDYIDAENSYTQSSLSHTKKIVSPSSRISIVAVFMGIFSSSIHQMNVLLLLKCDGNYLFVAHDILF